MWHVASAPCSSTSAQANTTSRPVTRSEALPIMSRRRRGPCRLSRSLLVARRTRTRYGVYVDYTTIRIYVRVSRMWCTIRAYRTMTGSSPARQRRGARARAGGPPDPMHCGSADGYATVDGALRVREVEDRDEAHIRGGLGNCPSGAEPTEHWRPGWTRYSTAHFCAIRG